MTEEKRRVNAAIDMKLYENVMKMGYTISEAITLGLEKLIEPPKEEKDTNLIESIVPEVIEAKDSLIQSLEVRTGDLNKRIESLEEQLKVKDTGYQSIIENLEDQLKAKDDVYLGRIEDFKEQLRVKDSQMENRVKSLEEQLKVKDTQLESKDSQLEKQAVHIQTLISQKAIEAPGAKKPWWRFW